MKCLNLYQNACHPCVIFMINYKIVSHIKKEILDIHKHREKFLVQNFPYPALSLLEKEKAKMKAKKNAEKKAKKAKKKEEEKAKKTAKKWP